MAHTKYKNAQKYNHMIKRAFPLMDSRRIYNYGLNRDGERFVTALVGAALNNDMAISTYVSTDSFNHVLYELVPNKKQRGRIRQLVKDQTRLGRFIEEWLMKGETSS